MNLPATFEALILEARQLDLYVKLIKQLNKDFILANIDIQFDQDISPDQLKRTLHETIFELIQQKFPDYLNLLYIIDVPEEKIKRLDGDNLIKLSGQVSFLVLLREWQKVWIKNKYS